jgi:LysM repeat protein
LVPQGSFEAQARGKSRVKFAFYTIVVIHVLAIAGFLIIGCKREDKDSAVSATPTNDLATPAFGTDAGLAAPTATNTNPPLAAATEAAPTNIGIAPTALAPTTPSPATPTTPAMVDSTLASTATEHTIVKGDTFATLATKYHVPVKDIQAANPNLNPTKLKIGDKVKIPAKSATTATGAATTALANGDSNTYKVKSGDTLSKIASTHKTTVKELQRLNNLTTTQIRVGQVLKLPPSAAAPSSSPQPAPAQ